MSESSSSHSQDGAPLLELPAVIRKNRRRRAVLVVVSALIAVAGFGLHQWFAGRVVSEWAAVQGAEYPLKAASAGKVLQVAVRDGQLVEAGELLLALDPVPLERALAEAEASLDLAMRGGVPAADSDPSLREAEEHARRVSDAARREEEGARIDIWNSGLPSMLARCLPCAILLLRRQSARRRPGRKPTLVRIWRRPGRG